jgi:hypothetical protein
MTDTDALRALADEDSDERSDTEWMLDATRMIRDSADEIDRLRAVIADAPHAADCRAQFHGGDRYGNGGDSRYCCCWKATVPEGSKE